MVEEGGISVSKSRDWKRVGEVGEDSSVVVCVGIPEVSVAGVEVSEDDCVPEIRNIS